MQIALGLVGFLLICLAVAAIGGHAVTHQTYWYSRLNKPSITPPFWVLTTAWPLLYGIVGIAAWLIWRLPRRKHRSQTSYSVDDVQGTARIDALAIFCVQLVLSLLWTEMFFHFHRLLVSTVVVLALWIAVAFTVVLFWRVRVLPACLMLLYLVWVSYATALNLMFLRLN